MSATGLIHPGYQHVHVHAHAHVLCAQGQHPKQRMQGLECLEPGAVVGRDLRAREEPHRQRRALQGCVLGVCERYRSAGSLRVRAATRPCVAAKATLNRLSYEPMRSRLYTMGACACMRGVFGAVCKESYQARAGHERSWHAHVAEQAGRLGSEVLEDGAKRRSAARG